MLMCNEYNTQSIILNIYDDGILVDFKSEEKHVEENRTKPIEKVLVGVHAIKTINTINLECNRQDILYAILK